MAAFSVSDIIAGDLPPDALFAIISRTDLKALASCRLISRQCRDLTYESVFMRLHGRRTETISGYFVQSLRNGIRFSADFFSSDEVKLPLDFLPVATVAILASSSQNGLLLCRSCNVNQVILYVCKQATRQWIRIPDPKDGSSGGASFGLAVLGSNPLLRFKVVRVFKKTSNLCRRCISNYHIQLFDSEKRTWKNLETVLRPNEFPVSTPASAAGCLHWLTSENRVLSLDAETENWEVTFLPRNLRLNQNLDLVESIRKLGVMGINQRTDSVELWVTGGRGKRWLKKETVDMGGVREAHGGDCCARGFYGSDVTVISSFNGLIFRDLRNGKDEIVRIGDHTTPEKLIFF